MMKRFFFWQRWLFVFSLVVVVFGMGMALFNRTLFFALFNSWINPIFWDANPLPIGVDPFQGWIYGVLGATMAGWGVILAFIAYFPFRNRDRWAWSAIALGLSLWYVTDTTLSLYFGVTFNAVFNTAVFILAILPLLYTRREFRESALFPLDNGSH